MAEEKKPGLLKRIFSFGFGKKKAKQEEEAAAAAAREAEEQAKAKEAERLAAEQAAKEEADRLAAEKAAQEEADRIAAEQAEKEEAERLAAEAEAKRLEAERIAAEEKAAAEAEAAAQRAAAEKAAAEKAEAVAKAAEEKAKAAEAARRKAEEEKAAAEEKEKAEKQAAEKAAKEESDRLAAEAEAKRLEAERLAAEEKAKVEAAERLAAEQAAKEEADRQAAEKAAQEEADRLAAEQFEKEEAERLAAEAEAERLEAERIAAEEKAKAEEADRLAAEEREALETAKREQEQEALKAETNAEPVTPEVAERLKEEEPWVEPEESISDGKDEMLDGQVLAVDREAGPASDMDEEEDTERREGWFKRLRKGLSRSSSNLKENITAVFTKKKLDEDTLQDLEDILIQADLGVETAMRVTDALSDQRYGKDVTDEEVRQIMAEEITKVLEPVAQPLELDLDHQPHVILVVGVNGSGKTTTIGKLSQKLYDAGFSTLLVAGDTFRAAAIEQLHIWGERTQAPVMSREHGADAAGLAFDAYSEAQSQKKDVVLMDTAGRLQNKKELMDELEKIIRVLKKQDPAAPHTVLLTLDATTGQNALNQVEIFKDVAGVNGLVMTKLDGTARGGILVSISSKHKLPVYFIGVGEQVEDLEPFEADVFARAIAGLDND
ncbi:MAG: signal recognition particle-docking protein FtsY [Pseudomonadota bacterium]